MGVVPGVVVDQCGSIGETGDLIAVVPPTHDDGVRFGVHAQPVVGLTVVVDDVFLSVVGGGEYN